MALPAGRRGSDRAADKGSRLETRIERPLNTRAGRGLMVSAVLPKRTLQPAARLTMAGHATGLGLAQCRLPPLVALGEVRVALSEGGHADRNPGHGSVLRGPVERP
ncbi:hypothetical protein IscW_ISCW004985 [Ixodes scapularis]|uniref:Uncharacterized protein n=1 Tax=Ixodes scapularis TaxID=6945 RepID=B7PFV8_IXOSC|nr:hypothetical protein IscW_ISCW004985 [Ixodes scapularis]|eukprot:XP_002434080.1 hypothetical protein IscW_ISCW004985 [Ixodes scapularis]